jgi:exopolyphosphatase/guanosine-5'-triphosphate,3'-diphosphate pyrophosphatase
MRVAAIDIGTNSVLLLIAEARSGVLTAVSERAEITRLGQGVDASRALAEPAVERTLACLARYAEEMRAAGVERIDAVGTSAMRDARGGEAFRQRARAILGVEPRVISGEEEARLTFDGALVGLPLDAGPVIVVDIGGGSTEVIFGHTPGQASAPPARSRDTAPTTAAAPTAPTVELAASLDVGSVRLTERHVRSDPPQPGELEAVRADVRAALATLPRSPAPRAQLIGVAGTVTTVAALVHGVVPYDVRRIHGATLHVTDLEDIVRRLASLTLAERKALPALDPGRADVILAGAVLLHEVALWAGAQRGSPGEPTPQTSLIASDRGVRWGLARRLV